MTGLLDGVRVLDAAGQLGVPWIGRHLAHHGAEVVTFESSRFLPKIRSYVQPNAVERGVQPDDSTSLTDWHSGKLSIGLDLTKAEGQEIFDSLVRISDMVLTNRLPRASVAIGVTYERLLAVNPAIIMLHNTSYGLHGPYKDNGAFGDHIEAMSGMSHLLRDHRTNEPGSSNTLIVDYLAGLHGLFAVLEALREQRRTGHGQLIDISMLEVAVSSIGELVAEMSLSGEAPEAGNVSLEAVPYGVYPCDEGDKDCSISVYNEEQWVALCEEMDRSHWANEPRFASPGARRRNRADLDSEIGEWTYHQKPHALMYRLQRKGIPAGVVQNALDMVQDPQLSFRRFFPTYSHPAKGGVIGTGLAVNLGDPEPSALRTGFSMGQDTEYLVGELLGRSDEEMQRLMAEGVIEASPLQHWPGLGQHSGQRDS
ncbi:CoA transferase [Dehalococcoidia bacterium]|nr:CoA transferase [Dehalococcoidia bacterium]